MTDLIRELKTFKPGDSITIDGQKKLEVTNNNKTEGKFAIVSSNDYEDLFIIGASDRKFMGIPVGLFIFRNTGTVPLNLSC